MHDLVQDLSHGLRLLWKSKGFTLIAVVSLALGIGFNTTIFSAVDALLLRPKAGAEPSSLVEVYLSDSSGYPYSASSYPDYRDYRDRVDAFSDVASYQSTLARYQENGASEYLLGEIVSGNFFRVLGLAPLIGRTLEPSDDVNPGGHPVVVVSEAFWRRRLSASREAVGQTLRLNGRPFTVVGVLPSAYTGAFPGIAMQFWVPSMMVDLMNPSAKDGPSRLQRRTSRSVMVKARLAPGATIERAQAEMDALVTTLREEYPDAYFGDRSAHLLPSQEVRIHPFVDRALVPVATVLMVVTGLVLLIAGANVANMLLARATARRAEVAIRLSLGSSRWRLIRQLLTESILLSSLGGGLGLVVAWAATKLILSFRPPIPLPLALDLTLNHRVLYFTLVVAIATGILFGLAPALQASRANLVPALKSEQTVFGGGGRRLSLRNGLVVVQVAMSLVLLIGAGLLLRSAANAQTIDPGFETENVVMLSSHLGLHGYDEQRGRVFYRSALERVQALAGIEAASLTSRVPLGAVVDMTSVAPEGNAPEGDSDWPELDVTNASPGYFETIGIPILRGRDFSWSDRDDAPDVAILNETAARQFWPGESAVGKRLVTGSSKNRRYAEVVGVVRDAKVRTLGEDPRPQVYFAYAQDYSPMMYVLARTRGNPDRELETVRRELLAMDPGLAFFEAKTMRENLGITLFPVRMGALLLGVFGALALLLGAIGLYGVVSYSVGRRTREIGIRMALGAARADVTSLLSRQGLALVGVGVALGWVLSAAGARALSAVLYGVDALDLSTFVGTAAVLLAVAFGANWIPARRAARIPPVKALRYE